MHTLFRVAFAWFWFLCVFASAQPPVVRQPPVASQSPAEGRLDPESNETLVVPPLSSGEPAAGKRVKVTPPEYAGTNVYHTLYLPPDWKPDGPPLPIVFEYTGNYFPASGSTGKVEDGVLGFGLSAGQYIWISLPYINADGRNNQVTWWGDVGKTVDYAKTNVPRIIDAFHADADAVFLCGFSRGAIGVNFIGLHDDEIASLWSAFISHDHFDGVKAWGKTDWGSPLVEYRKAAAKRLRRIQGRPYWVGQNGAGYGSEAFIDSVLSSTDNFTFRVIPMNEIFGSFPNRWAKTSHTDAWPILPSESRRQLRRWMNGVADQRNE